MPNSIEFKPINIIVGKNSSGKSTFVRSLPLIRQSLLTRTNAPILWFGDLVDFGSYKTAVFDHNIDVPIAFTIGEKEIVVDHRSLHQSRFRASADQRIFRIASFTARYEIGSRVTSNNRQQTILKSVIYKVDGNEKLELIIKLADDGLRVQDAVLNGRSLSKIIPIDSFRLPRLLFSTFVVGGKNSHSDERGFYMEDPFSFLVGILFNTLKGNVDKRLKESNVHAFFSRMLLSAPFDKSRIRGIAGQYSARLVGYIDKVFDAPNSSDYDTIITIMNIYYMMQLSLHILPRVKLAFEQCTYIGPVRARSNRYYRLQELSVSDIDPDGTNLPMFLSSLTGRQMDSFSNFVQSTFGFGVQMENSEGHLSLYLKYPHDRTNIVDSGFGVSQLLPVLAQLWWSTSAARLFRGRQLSKGRAPIFLAMEQPELHLHPAHQALLADIFVETLASAKDGPAMSLIIETHSSEIINRLGALIEAKRLDAESVQIIIFDESDANADLDNPASLEAADKRQIFGGSSRVQIVPKIVEFSEKGILKGWPADFFIPNIL
ncbi:AAA family ATPase [Aureimonas sp. Leaf460]|uniref:AAA family ATPase n=2 Tax=unclassified Aureimonas TaxID=2615206 RepID=UPI001AEC2878|nr:AAA family ATPase [Aureimonas sp. Leaf460]